MSTLNTSHTSLQGESDFGDAECARTAARVRPELLSDRSCFKTYYKNANGNVVSQPESKFCLAKRCRMTNPQYHASAITCADISRYQGGIE